MERGIPEAQRGHSSRATVDVPPSVRLSEKRLAESQLHGRYRFL